MSVINEMLRDLERRRPPATSAGAPVLDGLRVSAAPAAAGARSSLATPMASLVLVGVVLAGFVVWQQRVFEQRMLQERHVRGPVEQSTGGTPTPWPSLPSPAVPPPRTQEPTRLLMDEALAPLDEFAASPPSPAFETNSADGAAELRGARIERGIDRTRLLFELSRPAEHRVEQIGQGRIELILLGTRLVEAPALDLGGSLLRAVHVSPNGADVHVQLEPTEAVLAQSGLLETDRGAHLVLTLDRATRTSSDLESAPEEEPAKPEEIVATPAHGGRFTRTPRLQNAPETAEISYQRARELVAAGSPEIAVQALREALAYEPTHHAARQALVSGLLRLGRSEEAREALREGRRIAPQHGGFAKLEARLLLASDATAEALAVLAQAPPPLRQDLEYHAMVAALHQRLGDHSRAADHFKRLLSVRGDRAAWWMGLGISLEGLGTRADALSAYRNAAALGGLGSESQSYTLARIEALGRGAP